MAGGLRIMSLYTLYHIINRGSGQVMIFHNDKDWKRIWHFQERVMRTGKQEISPV